MLQFPSNKERNFMRAQRNRDRKSKGSRNGTFIRFFSKITATVIYGYVSIVGVLHVKNNVQDEITSGVTEFFSGVPRILPTSPGVHVVVSHCDEPIGWIWSDSWNGNYAIKSVTIITKCGQPIPPEDLPILQPSNNPCSTESSQLSTQPLVSVVALPNVGRCDHSYAYWIANVLSPDTEPSTDDDISHKVLYSNSDATCNIRQSSNDDPFQRIRFDIQEADLVVFMKDNDNGYRRSSVMQLSIPELLKRVPYDTARLPARSSATEKTTKAFRIPSFPSGIECRERTYDRRMSEGTDWSHRGIMWSFKINSYNRKGKSYNVTEEFKLSQKVEFASPYQPMGSWIQSMTMLGNEADGPLISDEYLEHAVRLFDPNQTFTYPSNTQDYHKADLVPLCTGGVFATQWGQLSSDDAPVTPRGWKAIARALSRGDNIEEGHYMERWWGDLLSWSFYARRTSPRKGEKKHNKSKIHYNRNRTMTVASKNTQTILFSLKQMHFTPITKKYLPGTIVLEAPKVEKLIEKFSAKNTVKDIAKHSTNKDKVKV